MGGSQHGQLLRRSLLMRAAQEGSLPVLKLLLETGADVNLQSPDDGLTALHAGAVCASGESALSAIQLLLQFGANRELKDHQGRRPLDVFMTSGLFNSSGVKEGRNTPPEDSPANQVEQDRGSIRSEAASAAINSQAGPSPEDRDDDPSTAEFRMYRFKVDACPHLQTLHDHDWTECPYAHPGEKARRRDLRKYNYTSTACPDFRKGTCKRGDVCQYAHGVFECWMHPSKYRTQLCKDAGACARTVCFFAHSLSELRAPPEGAEDVEPPSEQQPNLGADQSSFPTSASSIAQEQHVSTCGSIASAEALSREVTAGTEEWAQRGSFTQLMPSSVIDPPRSTGSIRQLVGMAAAEQLVPQRSAGSFPQMTAAGVAALDKGVGLGQSPLSQQAGAGGFQHQQQQQPPAGTRSGTPDSAASSVSLASLLDRLKVQSCASPSGPAAAGPATVPTTAVKQQPVVRNAAAGSLLASLGGSGGSVTSLSTTPYFTPPVSPGCGPGAPHGHHQHLSPGMTPTYSPAMSPLSAAHDFSMSLQGGGVQPFLDPLALATAMQAGLLPQMLAQLSPPQQLALLQQQQLQMQQQQQQPQQQHLSNQQLALLQQQQQLQQQFQVHGHSQQLQQLPGLPLVAGTPSPAPAHAPGVGVARKYYNIPLMHHATPQQGRSGTPSNSSQLVTRQTGMYCRTK